MAGVSQFTCVQLGWFHISFLIVCLPYTEDFPRSEQLGSVPQFDQRIIRVLQMSILSRHLAMMKSTICPCRERGCVQVVLNHSVCLNMVLITIRSNSVHSANRSSPLELHFLSPYFSRAKGHWPFSLPIPH